jgi:hypothetical protein
MKMRFTVLSCMNGIERLWIGTSDGEVFEIGYNMMMKLAEEKLLDKARTVKFHVIASLGVINRFYPPRRGILMQLVQHPFDGGFIVCGFNHRRKSWYIWLSS